MHGKHSYKRLLALSDAGALQAKRLTTSAHRRATPASQSRALYSLCEADDAAGDAGTSVAVDEAVRVVGLAEIIRIAVDDEGAANNAALARETDEVVLKGEAQLAVSADRDVAEIADVAKSTQK